MKPPPEFALSAGSSLAAARPRSRWVDFLDLTKPRMNVLVVITTAVGFYVASDRFQAALFLHTIIGTALTAAAASVLNQLAERRYDARMVRTRHRALAAGRLSPHEALSFAGVLLVLGPLWLLVGVNALTAFLGLLTLAIYVLVYTPLKRRTTLCTVVGAIPGAIPPVMGWTAVHNSLDPQAAVLFGILFFWQMPHFLAIAMLYRQDYAAAGFRMLPVVDSGLRVTAGQIVLYTLCLAPVSFLPALLGMTTVAYLLAAVVLVSAFLFFAVRCAIDRTATDARRLFIASIVYLPLLLAGMMLARL